jgi:hypothetical protein
MLSVRWETRHCGKFRATDKPDDGQYFRPNILAGTLQHNCDKMPHFRETWRPAPGCIRKESCRDRLHMLSISTPLVFSLLLTSVGASAIASLLLGLEFFASRSRLTRSMRHMLSRVVTPKVLWASVLLCSLIGSRYLAASLAASLAGSDDQHVVDLEDLPVIDYQAATDQGRPIGLFHFAIHTPAVDVERFMQASETQQQHVIRLADANPAANCHGWVFTGGRFGVRDSDVPAILADNGYVPVDDAREGDLALYLNGGHITHTGLARRLDPSGPILVQSKWGPFGLYLHPTDKQPFSGFCHFYRSPRPGHLLVLVPESAGSAAE